MSRNCVLCRKHIEEDFGKLKGTLLRVLNLNKKAEFIFVCSDCQKQENWIERAKVKSA